MEGTEEKGVWKVEERFLPQHACGTLFRATIRTSSKKSPHSLSSSSTVTQQPNHLIFHRPIHPSIPFPPRSPALPHPREPPRTVKISRSWAC